MDQIGVCNYGDENGFCVKLEYEGAKLSQSPHREIVSRGNLPLLIGEGFLVEIEKSDIEESWQSAAKMSDIELSRYCQRAATRLARMFDSEIASADLSEVVANAAALFVLSLSGNKEIDPAKISPCTVTHKLDCAPGEVALSA